MNCWNGYNVRELKSAPSFEIGDTVRVHVKVVEGEKSAFRFQRGDRSKGLLNTETFTVRKFPTASVWNEFSLSIRRSSRAEVMRQGGASSQTVLSPWEEGQVYEGRRSGICYECKGSGPPVWPQSRLKPPRLQS
jgi:ribosomal protein L19